ncbi:MAG: hypothetical protein NNA22_01330 [Nitrospira sp.]|nr:hypothetical protein [Nitrospira sp.]
MTPAPFFLLWAIVTHDGHTLYLVREPNGTPDFLKLGTIEADKVRCGHNHFEVLGVPFGVAVTAEEVEKGRRFVQERGIADQC